MISFSITHRHLPLFQRNLPLCFSDYLSFFPKSISIPQTQKFLASIITSSSIHTPIFHLSIVKGFDLILCRGLCIIDVGFIKEFLAEAGCCLRED